MGVRERTEMWEVGKGGKRWREEERRLGNEADIAVGRGMEGQKEGEKGGKIW